MNTKRLLTENNVSRETFNHTRKTSCLFCFTGNIPTISTESLAYFVSRETFNRFTTDLLVVLFHEKHLTISTKPLVYFVSQETFLKSALNSKRNLIYEIHFSYPTFNYKLCLLSVFKANHHFVVL